MFINTSDLFILSLLAAALIFLLSYYGGFQSGFKEGYSQREKERLAFDERERLKRKQFYQEGSI
jgi:hypothetical protein